MAPSSLQWLDFSEAERRKAHEVIALFREQDTRDELGIGSVRDAFADRLFPGTSTIQTRPAYALLVPWMYQELEARRVPSAEIAERARATELRLIDALASSRDPGGIIGIDARRSLQRLPSSIYWQGLHVLGIRLFPRSQDAYHRSLDTFYGLHRTGGRNDDGEPVEGTDRRNWHAGIPVRPPGFPREASLELRPVDAEYLRERIVSRASTSLLAHLLDRPPEAVRPAFPWLHPALPELPAQLQEALEHARNFSEAIHGAALLYNLMLAETAKRNALVLEYQDDLQRWHGEVLVRQAALVSWDRERFWAMVYRSDPRVPVQTRRFIDAWLDLVCSGDDPTKLPRARDLIRARELALKRGLARLENPRALERWGGAAGTRPLDFRWPVAATMIADIHAGLARTGSRA